MINQKSYIVPELQIEEVSCEQGFEATIEDAGDFGATTPGTRARIGLDYND